MQKIVFWTVLSTQEELEAHLWICFRKCDKIDIFYKKKLEKVGLFFHRKIDFPQLGDMVWCTKDSPSRGFPGLKYAIFEGKYVFFFGGSYSQLTVRHKVSLQTVTQKKKDQNQAKKDIVRFPM